MTTRTPLSPHTLTLTATLQDLMTSLRAFLSSLTMTTACSSHPPASPSCGHGSTRRTSWILTVGLHGASETRLPTASMHIQHYKLCDISPGICLLSGRYDSFEGLRAEECGILNGCENGRCVRVREGYTCDCFDGYEFDLKKMACIGGRSDRQRFPSLFFPF